MTIPTAIKEIYVYVNKVLHIIISTKQFSHMVEMLDKTGQYFNTFISLTYTYLLGSF